MIPPDPLADEFWRSRLDAAHPRAQLVPDFKRSAAGARRYGAVAFTLDPDVVVALRSLGQAQRTSDLVLCASLLTVVFAKYQRQDELIFGMRTPDGASGGSTVVPLRVDCEREATALSVIKVVEGEVADVLSQPPCPASRLAQISGVDLISDQCPFFDVAIAVGEGEGAFDFDTYPVDLAVVLDVGAEHMYGRIMYATHLFEASRIERLAGHLVNTAKQMTVQPGAKLADIEVLTADERHRILNDLSGRSAKFPLDRTMHGLFEDQVRRTPGNIAAVDRGVQLTYSELNERANRLARVLLSHGLERGQFVGLLLDRSCDFLTAMLAVFKAGGAYVPLDPTYPRDRIRYMLDDSQAAFVISNAAILAAFADVIAGAERLEVVVSIAGDIDGSALPPGGITTVGPDAIGATPGHDVALPLSGTDRAYMIYTSGSTGRPKGAICRHNGALNHAYGELEGLGIDSQFSFLQSAAASSDISVWQFVAPLLFGGATVIVDYEVVVDPARLFSTIRDHRLTVVELVPVVLRALIDYISGLPPADRDLPDLRVMMSTGEALAIEMVDRWLSLFPGIPLGNTYGPTETSDDVTLLVMREALSDKRSIVPIGRPLPNIFIFVLDRDLRPVPVGVPGEICIGGVGVGEGYWHQPEKTAAAFVPCPFPEITGGPMYRTGDLGRWLPDGTIEFLGRIDQQVKVRGFRVEPGEIEAVLTQHPAIQDAAVVAVSTGSGTNRLVGYFVTHKGRDVEPADVRQFLKGALADHMIPAALVSLPALPLTPLGKIDRKALSTAEYLTDMERSGYVAPADDVERTLAAAWGKVLGQTRIGTHDNYFEIGGDSILIIHIIAELKSVGLRVAPKQFFLHPTIAELAAQLRSATLSTEVIREPGFPSIERNGALAALRKQIDDQVPDVEEVYPLGATQRGIYLQSMRPSRGSGKYVEQIGFELTGDLERAAFAAAWQRTVASTDVLRSAVMRRGVPEPVVVVRRSATLVPEFRDWRDVVDADWDRVMEVFAAEDRRKGFDLSTPPLTRVTVIRRADTRWYVLWTYHHIILDGWSEPLVLNAVFAAYGALVAGHAPPATTAPRHRDFVAWAEAQDTTAAESFWRRHLAGFAAPVSISGGDSGSPLSKSELSHGWVDVGLADDDVRRLDEVARRHQLTFSTIVHGAWALLLHRHTTASDVVFGSVSSGRQCDLPGIESIRGVLVVTQPLRTRLAADVTVSSWLRALQLQMAEAREFEQTPLALIQEWCDVPPERRPLFDTLVVMANYLGSDLTTCRLTNLVLSNVVYITQPSYALTVFVVVAGGRTSLRLIYDKERYAPATARQLLDTYRQVLESIGTHPEQRLGSLLV